MATSTRIKHRIISSDDHVMEPVDLWQDRVDRKFKQRAPQVIRADDGSDWWHCDGNKVCSAFSAT